jgi:hypothetical protein
MSSSFGRFRLFICMGYALFLMSGGAISQSVGTSGTIQVTVTDPTGAVVPGALVQIHNPVSGHTQSQTADQSGQAVFHNVPFNPYHLSTSMKGFNAIAQDVSVRSSVPVNVSVTLAIATANQTVTVEGAGDLIETNPTAHTDIDNLLIAKLPMENVSSGLSSAITNASPGVAADSNGFFHPLGEHADTTFSVDNQPISDQQSRVFSNQLSMDAVQSMEVINGAPPAEFGDKTSLVARVTTKSGLGTPKPNGSITAGYGSFGTSNLELNGAVGTQKFGNFFSASGLNGGRFLDSPEFSPIHDKGNSESFFDRIDYQASSADSLHLDLTASRSWFQTPNDFDQQAARQDQRQQLRSFNIAPGYTHLFTPALLLTANAYFRQDRVSYFPSRDPFSDLPATLGETRRLTNAGLKTDLSYVKGIHNLKIGLQFSHTFLSENFRLGLTDPGFNAVCVDSSGAPVADPAFTNPPQCAGAGFVANPGFQPGLLPFDLSRQGGALFQFRGRTDIKQIAGYVQDSITFGSWNISAGLRAENYSGLSQATSVQPRLGVAYNIKKTGTVLRVSYARIFATPYNENLILSSSTGSGGLATSAGAFGVQPLKPGRRNQFNAGFQQAFGKYLVLDGEYFWKYTNPDFDFDVLFNTSLTFPIEWKKSKIDGLSLKVNAPNFHGWTAYSVMGHVRSRFFAPEVGGILFNSPLAIGPFRIDHDQAFQQTTHVQYQLSKSAPFIGRLGPWVGFNWSYESGLVAGSVPDFATAIGFTPDQQQQIGLFCGNTFATLSSPISSCSSSNFGATRVKIPALGTQNDDRNPARIAPRNLLDVGTGLDNLFRTDRYQTSLRFDVINLTNKVALYNFLSTFSGTHFVTPRSYQAALTFHF